MKSRIQPDPDPQHWIMQDRSGLADRILILQHRSILPFSSRRKTEKVPFFSSQFIFLLVLFTDKLIIGVLFVCVSFARLCR
jgi:hypothetical protein